jgi:hypothetical protein
VTTLYSCEYTDEEIEELWNAYNARCNLEQAIVLEKVVRTFLIISDIDLDIIRDCTNIRNFKGHKGEHEPDFVIHNLAVIETKNWDCYARKGYTISMNNANKEILSRFAKYPKTYKRILVIANPRWGKDVKEYLVNNGVNIIQLDFLATEENWFKEAYDIVEEGLNKLIFPSKSA